MSGPGVPTHSQRDREMIDPQLEREHAFHDREHLPFRERDRRTHSRVSSPHSHPHAPQHSSLRGHPHHPGIPLGPGGVSGPGMPPPGSHGPPLGPGIPSYSSHPHDQGYLPPIGLTEREQVVLERNREREQEYRERIAHTKRVEMHRMERDRMDRERERVERERMGMGATGSMAGVGMPHPERSPGTEIESTVR